MIYGLVAPGLAMAEALAANLCGADRRFVGGDLSTKLKLLGVDVASFGDPMPADQDTTTVVFEDHQAGVFQKLVLSADGQRLRGGMLVGDASRYMTLAGVCREGRAVPERPAQLLFGDGAGGGDADAGALADEAQICSCNNVTKGAIRAAIDGGAIAIGDLKTCTKAGTGCGGCLPFVEQILGFELARNGQSLDRHLCEHFPHTRQELFQIAKIRGIATFDDLLAAVGRGHGCEICKPAAASIFASSWNRPILEQATIQDTNDRFLANIQRGGTYSVIPRVPGGEITPEQLIVLGQVARTYDLYCKITGGQRIDLLGARVEQLPDIWETLIAAGFESGHAYGKALRTVKSCVGSTWCRYGVQDSTGLAVRLEQRYRGVRAPHKVKAAVSGCIRECAEAQSKDFGVIATENGWNLYLGGNGGSSPRHADLFATDLDEATLIRYLDRFFMYYIYTADRLQRTARWIEQLDGGIDYLRRVIIDDTLGIGVQLEADMQQLVDTYECEWAAVVRDPVRRATFRHYADRVAPDDTLQFVRERGQKRPADWPAPVTRNLLTNGDTPSNRHAQRDRDDWVRLAAVADVPRDGGSTVQYGETQLAVFHFASRGQWFVTQNVCPHRRDMVLARGLLGDQDGEPKVACPLHKRTFSLESGTGLSDPSFAIETYPVEIRDGAVWARVPPPAVLAQRLPCLASSPSRCTPAPSRPFPAPGLESPPVARI
jgi:nitrite reductase (NADH) large subunit